MNNKNRIKTLVVAVAIAASVLTLVSLSSAQDNAPSGVIETRSHVFTPVADGIYHVTGTGAVNLISHAMLIEGEHDLLVVDSHVSPNAGMALIDAIKSVSAKPVRYLINTHYHFDHAHGNQVFPQDVEIIGHRYTREKLSGELGNVLEESTFISFTEGVPGQIEQMQAQLATTENTDERAELQGRIAVQQAHLNSLAGIEPTPPNITIEDSMSIFQTVRGGGREIQIAHLGRGHTGGDVVVFLPEEKIIYTGDLMVPFLPYMGDAHVDEWPDALERLKTFDFDTLLPGHGPIVEGKERIDMLQAYLRDLWSNTEALKQRGLSAEQAAEQIDMTAHSGNYPQIRGAGADVRAIRRIYQLLDEA
ncbi:MBL fold metallo-hydrolase [Pseudohongiella sp.]|uniref:Metallo-beta-lactamase domain-containing protein n=1 Tax=marine sediment metagenome TaxID=412755 RepID=A0A0F9VV72_9ZZZZ|nr:MBL fold metallo-hydrolase [Pseudohongiella sp.]HDZ08027.1 MBL fold metallo-hydrolase [Pseudohongiella sp.]HEA64130.1 MBL fold metallo-hydrolase [Pseudohongiella sp.]